MPRRRCNAHTGCRGSCSRGERHVGMARVGPGRGGDRGMHGRAGGIPKTICNGVPACRRSRRCTCAIPQHAFHIFVISSTGTCRQSTEEASAPCCGARACELAGACRRGRQQQRRTVTCPTNLRGSPPCSPVRTAAVRQSQQRCAKRPGVRLPAGHMLLCLVLPLASRLGAHAYCA